MARHASLCLCAMLFLAGTAASQDAPGAARRAPISLQPWMAVAAGPASGRLECGRCGISGEWQGHATAVSGGLLIVRRLAVGVERRSWVSWFTDSGDRSEAVLGTLQLVSKDHPHVRTALRASLGRERYDIDGSVARTVRMTVGGAGAAIVLLPQAALSPTVALERWWAGGRVPAAGDYPGGAARGGQTSLVVGLVAH